MIIQYQKYIFKPIPANAINRELYNSLKNIYNNDKIKSGQVFSFNEYLIIVVESRHFSLGEKLRDKDWIYVVVNQFIGLFMLIGFVSLTQVGEFNTQFGAFLGILTFAILFTYGIFLSKVSLWKFKKKQRKYYYDLRIQIEKSNGFENFINWYKSYFESYN